MTPRQQSAITTIASHGWLAACPQDFRTWMIANMAWQHFSAGSGITHGGDDTGGLYCVGDGQIAFVVSIGSTDAGTGHNGLPGSWWGHAPLLGGPRLGSVVATSDTLCGLVRRATLRSRLATHPEDWQSMTLGVADLFMLSAGAHADLLISDSSRRVAATILRMGGWRHRLYRLSPPTSFLCSQDTLASATALSRNTVGKILRELAADGLIDIGYGRIMISDTRRLRALANND